MTSKNSGTLTRGTNDSHLGPETRPDGPGFSRNSVFRPEDPEPTLPGQFRPILGPRGFDPAPLGRQVRVLRHWAAACEGSEKSEFSDFQTKPGRKGKKQALRGEKQAGAWEKQRRRGEKLGLRLEKSGFELREIRQNSPFCETRLCFFSLLPCFFHD